MLKRILTVSVVVMTIFWAVGLAAFVPVAQAAIASGDLIKASGAAVYYYGADGKRYVFPNQATYLSWYPDFSGVKTITDGELAAIQIGGNVTYRPGVKLIKITTDPKVYAVASNGTLRWVSTEAVAVCLYGATWGSLVQDLSDAFFAPPTYTIGAAINACTDFVPATATSTASSINVDRGLVAGTNTGAVFNAALASDNPAAQTVALGATGVPVLKFNLSGSGTLNEVVLKRSGLGSNADYTAVYLYNGATRLTNGRTISSDTNTVTFANINLAISGTVTLTVKVEVGTSVTAVPAGTATASNQNAISLQSVNGNAVAGVTGNLMTIGSVGVSNATLAAVGTPWDVTLGSAGVELAKLSITSGINDATLYAITLRQGGSIANTNLANLKLKSGSYELASVAALSSDKAIFVLAAPFTIPKGQQKNFVIIGDITGGRSNDTIKFYLDEKTDANIMDALYGVGTSVTNNFNVGVVVTAKGGQLTLGNAGPASSTFAANTTNNAILKVNMSAERNLTVRKTKLIVTLKSTTDATNVMTDLAKVKNIKLVDLDTSSTLVGPVSDLSLGWTAVTTEINTDAIGDNDSICEALEVCTVVSSKELSDSYDMTAGQTRHLAIKADFDTLISNGTVVAATFDLSAVDLAGKSTYVYDNDSGEWMAGANIVPNTVVGVNQTVNTSSLTVTKAGIPTNAAYVKGTEAGDALGINLNAGSSDSLKLNRLTARVYANSAALFAVNAAGDTAANTVASTASLYDGSTLVKGPVNLTLVDTSLNGAWTAGEYYKADFTNLGYAIPAGSQKKLTIRLAYRNTMLVPFWTSVDLLVPTDLEVENSMGNLITPGIAGNLNSGIIPYTPAPEQQIKLVGGLTAAVDGNTPAADIAVAGSTDVNTTKYKFTSTDEAFTITGAAIKQIGGTTGDIVNVKVSYANASGSTVTKTGQLSAGVLTFSDGQLDMYVPVNSSAVMTIAMDINPTAAGAISGGAIQLCLDKNTTGNDCLDGGAPGADAADNLADTFIALGVASNTKIFGNANAITLVDAAVKAQTLRKTKVTAVNSSTGGSASVGPQTIVAKFKLNSTPEAGSNQNSVLSAITLGLGGSVIGAAGTVNLHVYRGSVNVSNDMITAAAPFVLTCAAAGSCAAVPIALGQNNEFNGEIEVVVTADMVNAPGATVFVAPTVSETLAYTLTTYTWNDGTATGAASTPVAGIPVAPTNALVF